MSDLEAIQNVLARAGRRRRWQRAWNGLWQGLFVAALVWLGALLTYKLAPIPFSILIGAGGLGLIFLAAGFLRGWFQTMNLQQTARCVDDRQHLQERLSTALELARAGGDENWRALLVADAARHAGKIEPRKLFPYRLPRSTRWALVALVLGASLGFMPEYRSNGFVAKQQDAAAVKDVGKRIVEITRRSLEQRPPALEPTHKAMESVEEAGLRLDKNPLTRNDALKDLANVADKLKSQLKELGQKNPTLPALEKEARNNTPGKSVNGISDQKQLDALQKALEKAHGNPEAFEKMAEEMQKLQKGIAGLPRDNSPASTAARQKMAEQLDRLAKQSAAMGQPMPNIEQAIEALKNNRTDDFQKDMDAATTDLAKAGEMAKTLEQMQQQSEKSGKDLPEQLKFGQSEAAQQTLEKMADQLKSGKMGREEMAKMLDEISRSVSPAGPYGKAADELKQAARQMKSGDKAGSAESLARAAQELEKINSEMADARQLQESLNAVNNAEMCLATHRGWGKCLGFGKSQKGGPGVGTWTDDNSQLYPEMTGLWDNSGFKRPDTDPRGLTDRGDPQLADNLAATKVHGQIAPGSPMPSITLKGVSIKGQSSVGYQEAAAAAQSDAQSALNQDQVPRAYQGTVKDYFNDLKK